MVKKIILIVLVSVIGIVGVITATKKGGGRVSGIMKHSELTPEQDKFVASLPVKQDRQTLLGEIGSDGIRKDVSPWLEAQKLDKETMNLLYSVAKADQDVFNSYDSEPQAKSTSIRQGQAVACLSFKMKDPKTNDLKKFSELLAQLRSRIYNTQDRVNAFHIYAQNRGPGGIPLQKDKIQEICELMAKGPQAKEPIKLPAKTKSPSKK